MEKNQHPPVFLVGLPASGKTTFGRALARRLGMDFIDLDFYISQRFRASVAEIFARDGEEAFRRRESAMLREVGEMQGVVVACGGGTPCFSGNMDYMNSRGLTVRLTASPEALKRRLLLGGDRRPLVKGKSAEELEGYILKVQAEREPYYSRAQVSVESSQLESRAEIAGTVDRFVAANSSFLNAAGIGEAKN
ncbi:MAG: shikimate kinase [Muribaculaceae bacterium]|nr:shikimate kinase [Muribaculaceae bacterium]